MQLGDCRTYVKSDVSIGEYILHSTIYNAGIVRTPKIYAYDANTNRMVMEHIDGMTVSDYYGEEDNDTPPLIYDKIREIINNLVNINIDYIDITGYNFIIERPMEESPKIWIIDFEHARVRPPDTHPSEFVDSFINGHCGWNPDFR